MTGVVVAIAFLLVGILLAVLGLVGQMTLLVKQLTILNGHATTGVQAALFVVAKNQESATTTTTASSMAAFAQLGRMNEVIAAALATLDRAIDRICAATSAETKH